MLNRKHHHKFFCIIVTSNNGGKCLHMKTRQIVGFPKQSSLAFGKYPIFDFHENAHYWNYLPILSITPLALFYAKGKFHLKMKKKKMLADIDECTSSVNDCHSSASCTNTAGSFSCSCNHPYTGNGKTCRLVAGKYVTFIFSSRHNFAIIMVFFKFDFC